MKVVAADIVVGSERLLDVVDITAAEIVGSKRAMRRINGVDFGVPFRGGSHVSPSRE